MTWRSVWPSTVGTRSRRAAGSPSATSTPSGANTTRRGSGRGSSTNRGTTASPTASSSPRSPTASASASPSPSQPDEGVMDHERFLIRDSEPVFPVADVVATVGYYRDVLGFREGWTWGEPPDFGGVRWGKIGVMFSIPSEPGAKVG